MSNESAEHWKKAQKWMLAASGLAALGLLLFVVALQVVSGAYGGLLWPALAFAGGLGLVVAAVYVMLNGRNKLALAMMGLGLVVAALVPAVVYGQSGAPTVTLAVDDRVPEVGERVTVTWSVSGADSVSVRRGGTQVSTEHSGQRSETIADRKPIAYTVTASNRSGTASDDLTIAAGPHRVGQVLHRRRQPRRRMGHPDHPVLDPGHRDHRRVDLPRQRHAGTRSSPAGSACPWSRFSTPQPPMSPHTTGWPPLSSSCWCWPSWAGCSCRNRETFAGLAP